MVFNNSLGSFDPYLEKIATFNLLKNMIDRCKDTEDMVDTKLLRAFIDQVHLRKDMLATTNMSWYGVMSTDVQAEVATNPVAEQGVEDALFDLSLVNPNEVASQLAEEN